jgi:hypothetical protein
MGARGAWLGPGWGGASQDAVPLLHVMLLLLLRNLKGLQQLASLCVRAPSNMAAVRVDVPSCGPSRGG